MPVCEYCRPNRVLVNENDMDEHVTIEHPYRCTLCPDSLCFNSHYTWIYHYTSEHKKRCPYCDALVGEDKLAKSVHFKQIHDYHPCTICLDCFDTEEDLVEHYSHPKRHDSHRFVCNICNKTLVNNLDFWYHCFEEYIKAGCCPLCQGVVRKGWNDKVQWGEHLKVVHQLVPCMECFEVFQNEHECKVHFKDQHRVTCPICHAHFPDEPTKHHHTVTNHRFTCAHCPHQSFPSRAHLNQHTNTVHKTTCSTCAVHFDTLLEYTHHYNDTHRIHCHHCAKSFESETQCTAHVNVAHGETLRHHCDLCATVCGTERELRAHRGVAHTGATVMVDEELGVVKCECSVCGEVCAGGERELVAHYKEMHVGYWDVSPPPPHMRGRASSDD